MPVSITRYKVLLSAPGDAKRFCDAADEEIVQVNRSLSETSGVELYPMDWRRDSRADSGDEPQALLNKQIVDNADIVLSIFYERFGTPTKNYGSGTEEEIRIALDQGKRVLLYFWTPPSGYQPNDASQFEAIERFRSSLGKKTLYKQFDGEEQLRKLVRHDFTGLVFELEGLTAPGQPALSLKSIGLEGNPVDGELAFIPNLAESVLNPKFFDSPILGLCQSIKSSSVVRGAIASISHAHINCPEKRGDATSPSAPKPIGASNVNGLTPAISPDVANLLASYTMEKPVVMKEEDKALITSQLDELGRQADEDFFYLGKLSVGNSAMAMAFGPTKSLRGSDEEKQKYEDLKKLVSLCRSRRDYLRFRSNFNGISGLTLGLSNEGTSPATHINIELSIPRDAFVGFDSAPVPSDHLIGSGFEEEDMLQAAVDCLYGNKKSATCHPYEDSIVLSESGKRLGPILQPRFSVDPLYGKRLLDSSDYETLCDWIWGDYNVVDGQSSDYACVRLKFDRAQQNTTYAFPSRLLIRENISEPIRYRITADEARQPIEGELKTK